MKHCKKCDTLKPLRAFYEGCYCCMECKKAVVNAYKRRTGYNVTYGRKRRSV